MLEALLESPVKEKVLLFLLINDDSYPNEIARNFFFNINAVQYQLKKMEGAGVIYSQLRGKVRLYGLNPNYPFRKELEALLQKTFDFLGAEEKDTYYIRRRQPQQPEKPSITSEKAVKKTRLVEQIQDFPEKIETLDFSTD